MWIHACLKDLGCAKFRRPRLPNLPLRPYSNMPHRYPLDNRRYVGCMISAYAFIRNTLVCKLLKRLFMLPKTQLKSKQWLRSCYRPFHMTLGTRVFETNPDPIAGWYLLTEKLTGSRMKLVWISRNRSKRSL